MVSKKKVLSKSVVSPVEPVLCRQCGCVIHDAKPQAPSVNVLISVRNQLEAKEGRRNAAEEQIFAVLQVMIRELNDKGPFAFCAKCQESFAQLIGNPDRLWIDLDFAKARWEEIHAEQLAEAEKKRAEAKAEQERRLRRAEEARRRQEQAVAAKASTFLAAFETPEARAQREAAERTRAEANRKADEWLKRLVEGKVLMTEVGYVNLASIDPRTSIEECRVPGCGIKGTATDLNDRGKPVLYNVALPVIACKDGEPIVKDGHPVLTKPRVITLCGPHAHRCREISAEIHGEERTIPYYAFIRTVERFQGKALIGRTTFKLGDVFQKKNGEDKPEQVKAVGE